MAEGRNAAENRKEFLRSNHFAKRADECLERAITLDSSPENLAVIAQAYSALAQALEQFKGAIAMTWGPLDIGEWDEFWLDTDHDTTEFEATPPVPCKHSAIRVPVLEEWKANREVWAWKCRLCGEPMYEVPMYEVPEGSDSIHQRNVNLPNGRWEATWTSEVWPARQRSTPGHSIEEALTNLVEFLGSELDEVTTALKNDMGRWSQ